jgi:lipoprotein-anchoring transpeptidase ErfK/SrfK
LLSLGLEMMMAILKLARIGVLMIGAGLVAAGCTTTGGTGQALGFAAPMAAGVDPKFRRTTVENPTGEKPGTVVIDTAQRFLYLVQADGKALRYGVGVGREGFLWKGTATIGRKAEWPGWTPPPAMRKRQPGLPGHMPGGINNPLGARAMYLHKGGRDSMYRIHGTNEPRTIGQAMSSGCIRMNNDDVIDLYSRVGSGTRVVVR